MSIFLIVTQLVLSLGLIIITLLQTTKSEGLGGVIGGKSSATFRGRKSTDEIIDRITTVLAIAFLTSSLLTAILS